MNPTRAQLIEGRDEALDHLGIDALAWERRAHETRRRGLVVKVATGGPTTKAAARTVALAEMGLSGPMGCLHWHAAVIKLGLIEPMRSRDATLAA